MGGAETVISVRNAHQIPLYVNGGELVCLEYLRGPLRAGSEA